MNAFLIAGTNSGVGKTTITIGLISAFRQEGYSIQPFKVGPDFIDTGYHSLASGNPSINLDGWMLSKDYNINNFSLNTQNCNIAVIEGVMGFYDGFSGVSDDGSSAEIAKWLNLPVILIVNAQSMARSVAAIIYGFENFDKKVNIAGIIFNNVSGENHFSYLKESTEKYCKAKVLGYFKKCDFKPLPSRHLGLVTVEDNPEFWKHIENFGKIVKKRLDLKKILKITYYEKPKNISYNMENFAHKVKIAIAKDNAFCFYYYDNLKILKKYGAEIIFFSPLKDKYLPEDIHALYLGGGYPELFAEELSNNATLLNDIKNFAENNGIIYAECGGFIYLTKGVHTLDKKFFPLIGIFNDEAVMFDKLKVLGYSEVTFLKDSFLGAKDTVVKGHEFHYSFLKNEGKNLEKIYKIKMRRKGIIKYEGYRYKNCIGSYVHLHFGSNETIIKNLIASLNTG